MMSPTPHESDPDEQDLREPHSQRPLSGATPKSVAGASGLPEGPREICPVGLLLVAAEQAAEAAEHVAGRAAEAAGGPARGARGPAEEAVELSGEGLGQAALEEAEHGGDGRLRLRLADAGALGDLPDELFHVRFSSSMKRRPGQMKTTVWKLG